MMNDYPDDLNDSGYNDSLSDSDDTPIQIDEVPDEVIFVGESMDILLDHYGGFPESYSA